MSALIKTTNQPVNRPANWILTQTANVYLCDTLPNPMPSGAVVIGEWAQDGTPIGTINSAEYLAIRPLGNESGAATDTLRFQYFMGHAPRQIGNPVATDPIAKLYPADNMPLAIEIRHKLFTGNSNPAWDGWGWRAEIVGGAASRSPTARAIGIYTDAACTQYRYTTGAFTSQPSAWQVDSQGQPLTVWATEYNPGLLGDNNDNKADVHHACLLGSAQEGHATLRATDERAYHEFWLHDQGYVPPPEATWVDTTATMTQIIADSVFLLSATVTGFTIGQKIRIGSLAAGELVFNGYWPTAGTPSNYIKTTAHYAGATAGMKIWKWA
jgi:hypothetical protein